MVLHLAGYRTPIVCVTARLANSFADLQELVHKAQPEFFSVLIAIFGTANVQCQGLNRTQNRQCMHIALFDVRCRAASATLADTERHGTRRSIKSFNA